MIVNSFWKPILTTATDLSVVCEIYDADTVPSNDGFDPVDALGCYAAVNGIIFEGVQYLRKVRKFGSIDRILGDKSNTASVDFSNLDSSIAKFEFDHGFEGLIMVLRLISRSQSISLAHSQTLFVGRCEKPTSANRDSLQVKATWILGGTEVTIPRRKFSKEDDDGRVPTDPEFEGFLFIPQIGTSTYSVRKSAGGILGLFGFKKTVQKTLQYSSYSNLDANRPVPEVLGRSQIEFMHIGYDDTGSYLRMISAACEGPISDFVNVRSTDAQLPLDGVAYAELYGLVGTANGIDPSWVAPGYYSRTAHIRARANNSTVDNVEPAPQVVGQVLGRLMTIIDGSGDWTVTDEWSDNPAAHVRWLLTDEHYFKLDSGWLDDNVFTESYLYCASSIIDRSLSDFVFARS